MPLVDSAHINLKRGGDTHSAPDSVTRGHVKSPEFCHPDGRQQAKLNRQKAYRIILHSDDRESGNAGNATFLLGDLRGLWGLKHANIDAGEMHWNLLVSSFVLSTHLQPKIIEVHGLGLPIGSDSFDSSSQGLSTLLAIVPADGADELQNDLTLFIDDPNNANDEPAHVYSTKAQLASDAPMSLNQVPGGKVTIKLNDRHGTAWATDPNLKWSMILTLNPVEMQVGN